MPDKKPKKAKPSVADQFSDDEMNQVKHYGQMLGGGVTPFDDAVEDALNKREAQEANAAKMRAAQTGGASLGPTQFDQDQAKQTGAIQRQADTQGTQQALAAQAQSPPLSPPQASGGAGASQPFPAQSAPQPPPGPTQGLPAPGMGAAPPPPAPGGPPPEEEGPPQ